MDRGPLPIAESSLPYGGAYNKYPLVPFPTLSLLLAAVPRPLVLVPVAVARYGESREKSGKHRFLVIANDGSRYNEGQSYKLQPSDTLVCYVIAAQSQVGTCIYIHICTILSYARTYFCREKKERQGRTSNTEKKEGETDYVPIQYIGVPIGFNLKRASKSSR